MKTLYRSLVAIYVLAINEQNKILLHRRANTGYCDGYYDLPAGHLEEGETLRQAALRELKEETGLEAREDDLEFVEMLHRFCPDRVYVDVFFRAKAWTGEAVIQEPEKCDDMGWYSLNALPEKVIPYQRTAIEDRVTSVMYREIMENDQL